MTLGDVFAPEKERALAQLRELTGHEHLTLETVLCDIYPKLNDRKAFWKEIGEHFEIGPLFYELNRKAYHMGLIVGAAFFLIAFFIYIDVIEFIKNIGLILLYTVFWLAGSVLVGSLVSWFYCDIPTRFKTVKDVVMLILWKHYLDLRKENQGTDPVETIRCPFDRHELEERLKDIVVEHSGCDYRDISRGEKLSDIFRR